jgi:hypothetical protein
MDVIIGRETLPNQLPKENPNLQRDRDPPDFDEVSPGGPLTELPIQGPHREFAGGLQRPRDDVRLRRKLADPNLAQHFSPFQQLPASQRLPQQDAPLPLGNRLRNRTSQVRQIEQRWWGTDPSRCQYLATNPARI